MFTVYETLSLMMAFGALLIALITLVIAITQTKK